jgi:hypothetical protein
VTEQDTKYLSKKPSIAAASCDTPPIHGDLVMLRDKTRTQESAQQPQAPDHRGLLSEAIASLEKFFPHPHRSSAPNMRMGQPEVVTTAREDWPDVRVEDLGHQPQAQQQQQSRPAAASQPGQRAVSGRRPLFRS